MKRGLLSAVLCILGLVAAGPVLAHFGMVIPSDQMVMQGEDTNVKVDLMFWHPFEGQGMNLDKPKSFGVAAQGKKIDLLNTLKEKKVATGGDRYQTPDSVLAGWPEEFNAVADKIYADFNKEHGTDYKFQLKK